MLYLTNQNVDAMFQGIQGNVVLAPSSRVPEHHDVKMSEMPVEQHLSAHDNFHLHDNF